MLELNCSSFKDVDTSTLLVGFMMIESQECSQNHPEIQLQRCKGSTLVVLW